MTISELKQACAENTSAKIADSLGANESIINSLTSIFIRQDRSIEEFIYLNKDEYKTLINQIKKEDINIPEIKKAKEDYFKKCNKLSPKIDYDYDDDDYYSYRNFNTYDKESYMKRQLAIMKNQELIEKLSESRNNFAGLGTNKVKRRLNKLSDNPICKATIIALEIEDKNISAKNTRGKFIDKIYKVKNNLILELSELFKKEKWIYGIQKSDSYGPSHVIYFEIPGCEQISWHFSPDNEKEYPVYNGVWDEKINSTLYKLEELIKTLI